MAVECPACGATAHDGDAFCGKCGSPLLDSMGARADGPRVEEPASATGGSSCLVCGAMLAAHEHSCRVCHTPRGYRVDPDGPLPVRYVGEAGSVRATGYGASVSDVPAEIRGRWNWGGCTMGCLWCLAMNLPLWALIAFLSSSCGLLALPVAIYLGVKGNELAWRHRRFDSVEHFQRVQRIWAVVGIALTLLVTVIYIGVAILGVLSGGTDW